MIDDVDLLQQEWHIPPGRLSRCLRSALQQLPLEVILILRKNPKVQILIEPRAPFSVWAYFPIRTGHGRFIVRHLGLRLQPETKLLLLFNETMINEQQGSPMLRSEARNECIDAMKEWRTEIGKKAAKVALTEGAY